jgi:GTP-binding protein
MEYIVAIVGRPNIGKSTLFNRLTKTKDAIVADQSGVTRDRLYRKAEWAGKAYTLVDTGGFVPESKEFFDNEIGLQVEIAIAEADHIIFLLDAETGITGTDKIIASKLKKFPKRITVVVNKVDNDRREQDVFEFYNLGLTEPIGISGLNGRNIGNMLDLITEDAPPVSDTVEKDERLRIAIIGKPNVGKSSLVNTLLNENKLIVSDIAGTTRDSIDSKFKYKGQELVLIDTAGLRRKVKVKENLEFYSTVRTKRAIDRCSVAIIMIDAESGITKQDIDILREAYSSLKGLIIAVNKWDLITGKETNTAKEFEEEMRRHLEWIKYIPIRFISVKDKQRLLKILDMAIEISENRKCRVKTSELNDYLRPIINKTPPPSYFHKFVKIKFMTQVESNPPVFTFFVNVVEGIKDNYKRYLERKIREKYKFKGCPILLKFKGNAEDEDN